MRFFDINNVIFTIGTYPLSYLELAGTFFGVLAVWMATRQKIISWPLGLINVSLFFVLFYQVHLYSEMLLQAFFFLTNIYGWYKWSKQNDTQQQPSRLKKVTRWRLAVTILLFTLLVGYSVQQLHVYLPQIFNKPASQPYPDAFIAIASLVAQLLLARRITDNWSVWMVVNFVAIIVFFKQGIYLVSFEYFLFLLLSLNGAWSWRKSTIEQI